MINYILISLASMGVAAFLICGTLLWIKRKEVQDYSRIILSVFSWIVALLFFLSIFGFITKTIPTRYDVILNPSLLSGGLLAITIAMNYPIEVMRPRQFLSRWTLLLFVPWLSVTLPMIFWVKIQEINSLSEMWAHIGDIDVILRLVCLVFVIIISLLLLFIPYNWRKSSADYHWIRIFTFFSQFISVLFCVNAFTGWPVIIYIHFLVGMLFLLYMTYYELSIRVLPPEESEKDSYEPDEPEMNYFIAQPIKDDDYWTYIMKAMDEGQEWRNPNTTVETLSKALGTNRIYVSRCIHEHTDMTFNDYLNKKRVDFMAAQLRQNPTQDHKSLYFDAGFRNRQTAYRNFLKFIGCSPTDYVNNLVSAVSK